MLLAVQAARVPYRRLKRMEIRVKYHVKTNGQRQVSLAKLTKTLSSCISRTAHLSIRNNTNT